MLSTARINAEVIAGAARHDEVEILAVGSRDPARAAAFAARHGVPRSYGGYDAVLADPDVEAVYISLPNALHVEWSVRALWAGKHVLCEKPLGRSARAVADAFDVAEAEGRLLMEGLMWRHHPQTETAVRLVREGAIGVLRLVRATFSAPLDDAADPRLSRELHGGALMDVGCYCVSAARLLAGEPIDVSAQQVQTADGVDTRLVAVMQHAGGVLSTVDCALDLPLRQSLEIVGSTGSISMPDPWGGAAASFDLHRPDGSIETIGTPSDDSYGLQLANLSRAIRGTEAPLLGRADAVGQASVIEALYGAVGVEPEARTR